MWTVAGARRFDCQDNDAITHTLCTAIAVVLLAVAHGRLRGEPRFQLG